MGEGRGVKGGGVDVMHANLFTPAGAGLKEDWGSALKLSFNQTDWALCAYPHFASHVLLKQCQIPIASALPCRAPRLCSCAHEPEDSFGDGPRVLRMWAHAI